MNAERRARFGRSHDREIRPEIVRALAFIGDRLQEPMTVADVARAAHLSTYHFHRVFRSAIGEPVAQYITRRRLELAAMRLAYEPWRSITDVALSSGFSSPSNFTKVFGAHFGCSPSGLRGLGCTEPEAVGRLTRLYGKAFEPRSLYVQPGDRGAREAIAREWDQRVRFETTAGLDFACLASPGGYALETLERTWERLLTWARQLRLTGPDGRVDAWGCAFDSPSLTAPEFCRYQACVPCAANSELPEPLFRGRLPQGRYAVFSWEGPVSAIEDAYRAVYSCWLPFSALALDDFSPWEHHVGDGPKNGAVAMELWLKVVPRSAR